MTFIDDCTRYTWVYPIYAKSNPDRVLASFIQERWTQDHVVVQRFRTDNGGEYVNMTMVTLLNHYGIINYQTSPYSHEFDGSAERYNRTIITATRSMLIVLLLTLWAEAITTAVSLRNRLSNRSIGK